MLALLNRGKTANEAGDFSLACACFEAAYAVSVRAGMLVSAANMRLKLKMAATALAMYRYVLSECSLLPAEQQMASRKLSEAQAQLRGAGLDEKGKPLGSEPDVVPALKRELSASRDSNDGRMPSLDSNDDFGAFNEQDGDGFGDFGADEGADEAEDSFGDFGVTNGESAAANNDFGDFDAGGCTQRTPSTRNPTHRQERSH